MIARLQQFRNWLPTQVLTELVRRMSAHSLPMAAATSAYYLMLSLFPFLIFLLNVISFTPLLSTEVIRSLTEFIPADSARIIEPILTDLVKARSGTLLSASLLLALWTGSNAIMQIIRLMNRAFRLKEGRSFIAQRALSVFYTLLLALMIVMVLVGPVFGDAILRAVFSFTGEQEWIAAGWRWVKSLLPLITLILGFALLYRFGPGFPKGNKVPFPLALLGGAFAAGGWLLVSFGFSYYVNNFGNYANTYGSLGGVIILMIWLFLSSLIILLGAELIASVCKIWRERSADPKPTVFDFVREHNERAIRKEME